MRQGAANLTLAEDEADAPQAAGEKRNSRGTQHEDHRCSLAVLALTVGVASLASAETYRKKRLRAAYAGKPYSRVYGYRSPDDSIGGYYEHRLDAVRFGSQRWWKICDEQHGGSNRP